MIDSNDLFMKHIVDTEVSTDEIIDELLLNPEIRKFVLDNDLFELCFLSEMLEFLNLGEDIFISFFFEKSS